MKRIFEINVNTRHSVIAAVRQFWHQILEWFTIMPNRCFLSIMLMFAVCHLARTQEPNNFETNAIGMTFARLPAGEFRMGTKSSVIEISSLMTIYGEQDRLLDAEKPRLTVQVSSFLLQTTEVTQSQWQSVMDTQPWKGRHSFVKEGPLFPAQYVTWNDAMEFCTRLGKVDGNTYRLPTEAEWEYACRAGSDTLFFFGDDTSEMDDFGWTSENAYSINESYAHRTARRKPNGWGLYDMHGNVWEWCSDQYRANHDPKSPQVGNERVIRGGSWRDNYFVARSACRVGKDPGQGDMNIGFRVVCERGEDSIKRD